jgi:hypothetical protein
MGQMENNLFLHLHAAHGTDLLHKLPKIYNAFVAGGARLLGFDTNENQTSGHRSPATQYIGMMEGRERMLKHKCT